MPETKSFLFENHPCRLVIPDAPAKGRPWVWRAEFFGAFDTVDRALLERGWYIAYCSLSDRYGCPSAVADMKRFHDHLVSAFGLCEKAALFGFSRGGLYAFNYSLLYPQDVAVLYLDAPVLDICSWPGGLGRPRAPKKNGGNVLPVTALRKKPFVKAGFRPFGTWKNFWKGIFRLC